MILAKNFLSYFFLLALFSLSFFISIREVVAQEGEICPGKIYWTKTSSISFSKIEKTLLCGDPKVEAYAKIPFNQAQYFLKNFLQDRAYHQPRFEIKKHQLWVDPGPQTKASKVIVNAYPPFLEMPKKRKIIGRSLTPKLLNEIQAWIRSRVNAQGYACPILKTQADIVNGQIVVDLDYGPKQKVISITQEEVKGLGPEALRKYDAFQLKKAFNRDLLELTSIRVKDSGVLQTSFFTWTCEGEGVELFQRTFAGKPRIFRLGFGASTDELAIFRSSWRHARLGKNASTFSVLLYASFRQQYIDLLTEWYAFSSRSRWFVEGLANFRHERESDFQFISNNLKAALGRTYDNQVLGLRFSVGPNFNLTRTFKGARPGLTQFLTLRYEMTLMSHYWEIYQDDPRQGYRLYLIGDFGSGVLASSLTAQRFRLEGQYLYNLLAYDPPLLVIGIRGGLYGTLAANNEETRDILPPNYKYYLGGSQNLRGFSRKELPNENGALSVFWAGLEIRLAHYIPYWIQPFLFLDVGVLGDQAFHFESPVYFAPGAGIRVGSPVGVFRTTFAYGLKTSEDDGNPDNTHFQFYFTYGEEF